MQRSLTLLLLIILSLEASGQSNTPSIVRMPVISQVHATFQGIRTSPSYVTERPAQKIEGYVYTVQLELNITDYTIALDSLIAVVCTFPDNSIKVFNVESDKVNETSTDNFGYSFPLEIRSAGWYSFILATKYEVERAVDQKFYQEVSNRQSILLLPPSK